MSACTFEKLEEESVWFELNEDPLESNPVATSNVKAFDWMDIVSVGTSQQFLSIW